MNVLFSFPMKGGGGPPTVTVRNMSDVFLTGDSGISTTSCFEPSDYVPLGDRDLFGLVLVLDPVMLRPSHRNAREQLFIAQSGKGLRTETIGQRMRGIDVHGKELEFRRPDFLGILGSEMTARVKAQFPDFPILPLQLAPLPKEDKHPRIPVPLPERE